MVYLKNVQNDTFNIDRGQVWDDGKGTIGYYAQQEPCCKDSQQIIWPMLLEALLVSGFASQPLCLDVYGGSSDEGTSVFWYKCTASSAQQWESGTYNQETGEFEANNR